MAKTYRVRIVSTRTVKGTRYAYAGVQLPEEVLSKAGIFPGQEVKFSVTKAGNIILKRAKKDCPYAAHALDCDCRGMGGDR